MQTSPTFLLDGTTSLCQVSSELICSPTVYDKSMLLRPDRNQSALILGGDLLVICDDLPIPPAVDSHESASRRWLGHWTLRWCCRAREHPRSSPEGHGPACQQPS